MLLTFYGRAQVTAAEPWLEEAGVNEQETPDLSGPLPAPLLLETRG